MEPFQQPQGLPPAPPSPDHRPVLIGGLAVLVLCLLGVIAAVQTDDGPTPPKDTTPVSSYTPPPDTTSDLTSQQLIIRAAWAQISDSDRVGVCEAFNIDEDWAIEQMTEGMEPEDVPPTSDLRSFFRAQC